MKTKTTEEIAEIARLRKELKEVKRQLGEEILHHRIDIATLEILCEDYHLDIEAVKKKSVGMKSPIA